MIMDDSLMDGLKMIERENEIEYTGAFTCSTVLGHMKFQVRFNNLRHDPLISRTYFTWFCGGIYAHDAICTVLRASADFLIHFLHYDFCAFCKRHIQKSPFWRFPIVFRKRTHFGNKEVQVTNSTCTQISGTLYGYTFEDPGVDHSWSFMIMHELIY